MSVSLGPDGEVQLIGLCGVDDAEPLLRHLAENPLAVVDWRRCDAAHTAVIQVMASAGVTPVGPPRSRILLDVVEPLLKQR